MNFRPRLTKEELGNLIWLLDAYTEYLFHDDRFDHGMGRLTSPREREKKNKEWYDKWRSELCFLYGKLYRLRRRAYEKHVV